MILIGKYASFSLPKSEIQGFSYSHESGRSFQGMSLGESEINFSSNIDDKFYGSIGFALIDGGHASGSSSSDQQTAINLSEGKKNEKKDEDHDDKDDHDHSLSADSHSSHSVEIELEEAYIKTLPNSFLPNGFNLKFGKAFWTFGYLNEHHVHTDDFIDRPLPYRIFLNKAYNDLGSEISYIMPFDFYMEVGGGLFQGNDFPFGGNKDQKGFNSWSSFLKFGGDIGSNQSWKLGTSLLSGGSKPKTELDRNTVSFLINEHLDIEKEYKLPKVRNVRGVVSKNAAGEIDHKFRPVGNLWLPIGTYLLYGKDIGGRLSNNDKLHFVGNTTIGAIDFKWTFSPNGKFQETEISLQGEYFFHKESGIYEDDRTKSGLISFKGVSHGWYAQTAYKFFRNWQLAFRYSILMPPDIQQSIVSLYTNDKINDQTESHLVKDYKTDETWVEHKNVHIKFDNGKFSKPFLVIPGSLVGTSLDSQGHKPNSYSLNLSYMNSEFSKIDVQYNQEELSLNRLDKQFVVQYTMSLGAHTAHSF